MTLPWLLMLTDRSQLPPGRSLPEQIGEAVRGGVRAVVLRERDLRPDERSRLAADIATLLEPVEGVLIAASPAVSSAAGVHLRSNQDLPDERPTLLGRSCHTAADLGRARTERIDYVVLGPVATTASKPGYGPALERTGLSRLLDKSPGPYVYALGGVTAANAAQWLGAGADGVAVMGELMRTRDPAALTRDLLHAVRPARTLHD